MRDVFYSASSRLSVLDVTSLERSAHNHIALDHLRIGPEHGDIHRRAVVAVFHERQAIGAREPGLDATVRLDACRAIDLGGSRAAMTKRMEEAGVRLARSALFSQENDLIS